MSAPMFHICNDLYNIKNNNIKKKYFNLFVNIKKCIDNKKK